MSPSSSTCTNDEADTATDTDDSSESINAETDANDNASTESLQADIDEDPDDSKVSHPADTDADADKSTTNSQANTDANKISIPSVTKQHRTKEQDKDVHRHLDDSPASFSSLEPNLHSKRLYSPSMPTTADHEVKPRRRRRNLARVNYCELERPDDEGTWSDPIVLSLSLSLSLSRHHLPTSPTKIQ